MRISFTPTIQKTSIFSKKINNTKMLSNDIFVRSTSFGQITDNKSFVDFDNWAKATKFKENAKEIIKDPKNYLGKDSEGHSYRIPNCDKWIIKKPINSQLVPIQVDETTYTEVDDISPRINIGQPIASLRIPLSPRITEHYYVHKAQVGGKLGVHQVFMKNINSDTARIHIESLSRVANLEQESFDELIQNIKEISDMGYSFNGKQPNNLSLDTQTKRITLSGLTQNNKNKKSQFSEVLYALLGSDFAERFGNSHRPNEEKKQANRYSTAICAKFLISMKNAQVKFSLTDNFENLVKSDTFSKILKTNDNMEKVQQLRNIGLI